MVRWLLLLRVHDYVLRDSAWPLEVRVETCRTLQRKMLEIQNLEPLELPRVVAEIIKIK